VKNWLRQRLFARAFGGALQNGNTIANRVHDAGTSVREFFE
jgi:hypothetical protein